MSVNAYVNFRGNCREAVLFYATVFGCDTPQFATYSEYHAAMNDEEKDYIMYTELSIAGSVVQFSDTPSVMPYTAGNNVSLSVQVEDEHTLRKWFDALSVGGDIQMPLQETPWSKNYGSFTDKFGINWQFNQTDSTHA